MRRPRTRTKPLPAKQPLQGRAYQALAKALRDRAGELGLSVRGLADRLGKPPTTVHKTLWGQRRLDPIEYVDWCDALGVTDPIALVKATRN